MLLWVGCTTTRDPLAGWSKRAQPSSNDRWHHQGEPFYYYWGNIDQAIIKDYESYVETTIPAKDRHEVPTKENGHAESVNLYEDGTGKHAIKISYYGYGFLSSPRWNHVLIYDTNNVRIKTIKYKSGHSWHH